MKEKDISELLNNIKSLEEMFSINLEKYKSILIDAGSIWQRCPFNVGDRVMLAETPEITAAKSWGWLGSKHFLIKGAKATIIKREFYYGSFIFGVSFDDESWIDHNKIVHPVDQKSIYMFGERWFVSINYDQLTCEAL